MASETQTEIELLSVQLARLSSELANDERRKQELVSQARRLPIQALWCRGARNTRRWIDYAFGWRVAGVVVTVAIAAGLLVIVTFSFGFATLGGLACGVLAGAALFMKDDRSLVAFIEEYPIRRAGLEQQLHLLKKRIPSLRLEISNTRLEISNTELRRAAIQLSALNRRQSLLNENWKAMRSTEFEDFLADVFSELGFSVEMTPVSGDQGVDLIIQRQGRRTAVQVKGYLNSVSNGAVQEAFAGCKFYRCDTCAVITNSRFTASAAELAERIGCTLIDEDSLADLVLGNLDI